ncbi:hypothetical protein C8R48DRAFT_624845, partial [Suillus tomentosus]
LQRVLVWIRVSFGLLDYARFQTDHAPKTRASPAPDPAKTRPSHTQTESILNKISSDSFLKALTLFLVLSSSLTRSSLYYVHSSQHSILLSPAIITNIELSHFHFHLDRATIQRITYSPEKASARCLHHHDGVTSTIIHSRPSNAHNLIPRFRLL